MSKAQCREKARLRTKRRWLNNEGPAPSNEQGLFRCEWSEELRIVGERFQPCVNAFDLGFKTGFVTDFIEPP